MLLYVENKAYPLKTFVVLCQPSDTVARVRAQLLHSLYEIGHSNHQFRLRHRGTYLRDAYTLEEYKILNNAVIAMIPLNDFSEWNKDMRFHQSQKTRKNKSMVEDLVQIALRAEIRLLNFREMLLRNFKTLLIMQIMLVFLALFTEYWYFFFIYAAVLVLAFLFCPSFTRIGGWVGKNSVRRKEFMIAFGVLTLCMIGAGIALLTLTVIELTASTYPTTRCRNSVFDCFANARDLIEEGVCYSYQKQCYETSVWTAIFFCIEILIMIVTSTLCWILLRNFKFEVGDQIERFLIQTREIIQILSAAKHGSTSEKRNAAFELATLASSGDDNKFQIVAEGGLEMLISLGLSDDSLTQEYATEAIAECLTVPAIQDQFVSVGGIRMLTALLHAKNPKTVQEAIIALSYVVSDSDENKPAVVADHGLEDMLYACKYASAASRKALSSIYFELADYDDTRIVLTARTTTIEALLKLLSRSSDENTLATTLQTLELLTIESPQLVTSQEALMKYLLVFPTKILDKKLQFLAAKLLLQYAENPESCDQLACQPTIVDNLLYFVHSSEPPMHRMLANIAFRMSEILPYRERLENSGLIELLNYLQNSSSDRETWNLADQAIANLQAKDFDEHTPLKNIKRPPSATSSLISLESELPLAQLGPRQRTNISIVSTLSNVPGPSGLSTAM